MLRALIASEGPGTGRSRGSASRRLSRRHLMKRRKVEAFLLRRVSRFARCSRLSNVRVRVCLVPAKDLREASARGAHGLRGDRERAYFSGCRRPCPRHSRSRRSGSVTGFVEQAARLLQDFAGVSHYVYEEMNESRRRRPCCESAPARAAPLLSTSPPRGRARGTLRASAAPR
ncbi:unnamed protein product, partial [Amoebophrya sp. A120]|eukprot:GSA120T00004181001.1